MKSPAALGYKGPGYECGLKSGQQIVTWELGGLDQVMTFPTLTTYEQTGTIQDTYPDVQDLTTPMCIGVANNSKAPNTGLVIGDCQTASQGPGQYWKAVPATNLGGPLHTAGAGGYPRFTESRV